MRAFPSLLLLALALGAFAPAAGSAAPCTPASCTGTFHGVTFESLAPGSVVEGLGAVGRVVARSSVWETAAVGPPPDYLNAAVAIESEVEPEALLAALLEIERREGRVRSGEQAAPKVKFGVL